MNPDPWLRFWALLTHEYRALVETHGDAHGTAIFQERMDRRAIQQQDRPRGAK